MDTERVIIRVPPAIKEQLEKEARLRHVTVSALVREYIDKGMKVDGYKSDMDMISEITKDSLKSILMPQIERLVKILIKIGKISAAGYFMMLSYVMHNLRPDEIATYIEVAENSAKLGIDYINQKDANVETYLKNHKSIADKVLRMTSSNIGGGLFDDVD